MMSKPRLPQGRFPKIEVLFFLIIRGVADPLCLAEEHVAFSRNDVHFVVGEYAPPLFARFYESMTAQ